MTIEEFNQLVESAYEAAFSFEQKLIVVYEQAYARQTKLAVKRFRSQTITAAWTPPIYSTLSDGMDEKEVAEADRVRDEAAAAILAIFVSLGLAAYGQEFMEAISERAQQNFVQEIQRQLRKIVSASFDAGLSAEATAAAIREQLPQVIPASAQMLAQTELTALVNEKSITAAQTQFPDGVSKTWLCLLPETRVRGLPVRVSRREQGERGCAVSLTVASSGLGDSSLPDRNLTVTPNHPVLTDRGWVEAQFVQPGDNIFGCPALDVESIMEPDEQDIPPTIVEVFDAAAVTNPVEWMMSAVVDLDGNREECEVEVVAINGELRDRIAAHLDEELPQLLFSLSDLDLVDVFSDGDADSLGLGSSASLELQRALAGSNEGSIAVCDPPRFASGRTISDLDSTGNEDPMYRLGRGTDASSEFAERLTGFVSPLEVISVEVVPWPGYVYNLETENKWFIADSIIVHNTVGDNRVRAAHASAQGQTVPIDQPFSIGGSHLMYPGDPNGQLRLVLRCRCRLSFTDVPTAVVASVQEDTLVSTVNASYTVTDSAGNDVADAFVFDFSKSGIPLRWELAPNYVLPVGEYYFRRFDEPFSTITITTDDESPAEDTAGPMEDGPAWRALLAIEGVATEDGRMLAEGSLTWRELPLSLTAMDTSMHGAEGEAKVAGRIDRIWRDGNEVWGEGVFNTDEFGTHIYELVSNQSLRGNSIEPAVIAYEIRNLETGEVLEGEAIYDAMMNDVPLLTVFLEAVIMCSTIVATPALADANIVLASGLLRTSWFQEQVEREVLTASAAGMAPLHPPAAWFENPKFDRLTGLIVTDEGRVMGHAAGWDSCHIGEPRGPGICVPPPRSGMSYEIFHHGLVRTEEGQDVPCGPITMSAFHATDDRAWKEAREHYEHSGCVVADVVAGEDRFGIWVSGALRPDISAERVREFKAGALSGDWRDVIGRGLEFLGALVVNIPGFPIPRPRAVVVASANGEEQVLALTAAGIVPPEPEVEGMSRREYLRKIRALTA